MWAGDGGGMVAGSTGSGGRRRGTVAGRRRREGAVAGRQLRQQRRRTAADTLCVRVWLN
jgi:hypothetical protein